MIKGHANLIKEVNRKLILEIIRTEQPISRASISRKIGSSRSTVSIIVDELLKKKLIMEKGKGQSGQEGGRRAIQLVFNPKSAFGIGVDIGGTKTLMIMTELDGKVVYKKKVNTVKEPEKLIHLIEDFIKTSPATPDKIATMGIGIPAVIDSQKGFIIDSPNLGWKNIDFIELLKKTFTFPIFLNNDVNCAIFGEQWLGAGKEANDLVFIAIGTGVGSAILSNGKLIEGSKFSAGEIGYLLDRKDVETGNFEQIGSEFGFYEKRISGSGLSRYYGSGEALFLEYAKGNIEAKKHVEQFLVDLSIGIANIVSLLNPEKVILGGGVAESMQELVGKVNRLVKTMTPMPVKIELSCLRGDASALGAVAYAFDKVNEL